MSKECDCFVCQQMKTVAIEMAHLEHLKKMEDALKSDKCTKKKPVKCTCTPYGSVCGIIAHRKECDLMISKAVPPVVLTEESGFCPFLHKLPNRYDMSKLKTAEGDWKIYDAVVELQNIVEKLLQEKK